MTRRRGRVDSIASQAARTTPARGAQVPTLSMAMNLEGVKNGMPWAGVALWDAASSMDLTTLAPEIGNEERRAQAQELVTLLKAAARTAATPSPYYREIPHSVPNDYVGHHSSEWLHLVTQIEDALKGAHTRWEDD